MTSYPRRFAIFRGQDCLVPRHLAERLSSGEDAAAPSSVLPEALSWSASELPPESFSGASQDHAYSAFSFQGTVFGATLLDDDDARFAQSAGMKDAVPFSVRDLALNFSSPLGRFALLAKAHAQWAAVSRFCGACGGPLVDANGNEEVREPLDDHANGARFCPRCKRIFFPRMSPAVIVLVRKGTTILLEHNVRFSGNRHSLIAGFVEIGETLEEAAVREIREEAGIEVKNLRYVRSQPWPFPDSLMVGFLANWADGEARPDGVEIDHLGWYTADDLPEMPMRGSIARFMIDTYVAGGFSGPRFS
jgi:NAD+ diphosphatase